MDLATSTLIEILQALNSHNQIIGTKHTAFRMNQLEQSLPLIGDQNSSENITTCGPSLQLNYPSSAGYLDNLNYKWKPDTAKIQKLLLTIQAAPSTRETEPSYEKNNPDCRKSKENVLKCKIKTRRRPFDATLAHH
ncbi:hypothetical protein ACLOJK_035599, partial [Asimina triloba]